MRRPSRLFISKTSVCVVALLSSLSTTVANAQQPTPVDTVSGVQPERGAISMFPWERIDLASGNLTLQLPQLTLPGDRGHTLRILWSYNSRADINAWQVGIEGVPRIFAEECPVSDPIYSGSCDVTYTGPTFMSADGTSVRADIAMTADANPVERRTENYWIWNRSTHTLRMPNGITIDYNTGIVSDVWGPLLSIAQTGQDVTITQYVGGDERSIVMHLAYNTGKTWLTSRVPYADSMTFQGRHWDFMAMTFPDGSSWHRDEISSGGSLSQGQTYWHVLRVTTPSGGSVDYTLRTDSIELNSGGGPPQWGIRAEYVKERTARDVGGVVLGTWIFDYVWHDNGPYIADVTTVTSPTPVGEPPVITRFEHGTGVGGWWSLQRTVTERGGVPIEEREVDSVERIVPGYITEYLGVLDPLRRRVPSRMVIKRDGHTYVTEYTYRSDDASGNYSDYGNPRFVTEYGQWGEPTQTTRVTEREYFHSTNPSVYYLALPAAESVSEDGTTFKTRTVREASTGFVTATLTTNGTNEIRTEFEPDTYGRGNVGVQRAPGGAETSFQYTWGVASQITTAAHTTTKVVNIYSEVESETAAGRTTTYTYDTLSRIKTVDPPGVSALTLTTYDPSGHWIRRERGTQWATTSVDGFGRPIRTENSEGVRSRTAYDAQGRVTYQSHPFVGDYGDATDIGVRYEYDGLGRLTKATNADNTFSQMAYVANGVDVTDENGHTTHVARRAHGQPTQTLIAGVTDAQDNAWSYQYDALGNLRGVTGPGGTGLRSWVYDTLGRLTSETHPESGTTTFPDYYAGTARLMTKHLANGASFEYHYDTNDRLDRITSTLNGASYVTLFDYEPGTDRRKRARVSINGTLRSDTDASFEPLTGRLESETQTVDGKAFTVAYEYDARDNVTKVTYPSGTQIYYAYNTANQVVQVCRVVCASSTAAERLADDVQYDPSGAIKTYLAGNGVRTTMTFHPTRSWLKTLTVGAGPSRLDLTYDYDDVGNVETIVDATRPAWSQAFTYDLVDRLYSASSPVYGPLDYRYDAHGNWQTAGGATYGYTTGDPFHLRTVNGQYALQYDGAGNLESGLGGTYAYTADNQLKAATINGVTTTYLYDADQWRVEKAEPGKPVVYTVRGAGGQLLSEWTNASPNATVRDYVYVGSRLIAVISAHRAAK